MHSLHLDSPGHNGLFQKKLSRKKYTHYRISIGLFAFKHDVTMNRLI